MQNIEKFLEFSESLKLVRNANVEVNNKVIIDDIYTDLLPNNGILNKVNLPRTTILIGRKGTGKSTIFQKSQREIDKNKNYLSIYIDVKTLYDNASPTLPPEIKELPESTELTKYLIYSNFVKEIILKTKCKLRKRIERNYIVNVLGLSEMLLDDVYTELDNIEGEIDKVFKQLNTTLVTSFKNSVSQKVENSDNVNLGANTTTGISVGMGSSEIVEKSLKTEFSNSLLTYLDLKKCFIDNIIKIRNILKIKNLFIYLDDFSEIDKYAQTLFMDWFIAPVNNLSEDFVKFKIATYPKRFHYGRLDNAKIDKVSLDFFDAFYTTIEKKTGTADISAMERLALDYTERLLLNRFKVYFPNNSWEELFEITPKELYEHLFISTMNIPRKMGYILSYCHESCLIHDIKIGKSAIENAALRYYNDVIEEYFLVNEYVCRPFGDKVSNEHQYELLNHIIKRQITNKEHLMTKKGKNIDTSHFFVSNDLAYLLDNLELNGFISIYNQKRDTANVLSNIYCIDLGLCKKFNLIYGKLCDKTNKHTLPPLFNFNKLIMDYFNETQVIKCDRGHELPYSDLDNIKLYGMKCPTCVQENIITACSIQPKYADIKQKFEEKENNEDIKISLHEYMLLDILKKSQQSVSYEKLSSNVDMSLPFLRRIIEEKMLSKGWIEMDLDLEKALNKEYVRITSKGARLMDKINKIINKVKVHKL